MKFLSGKVQLVLVVLSGPGVLLAVSLRGRPAPCRAIARSSIQSAELMQRSRGLRNLKGSFAYTTLVFSNQSCFEK